MSDKYKQEIEEILKRAEDVMPEDRSRPQVGPQRHLAVALWYAFPE